MANLSLDFFEVLRPGNIRKQDAARAIDGAGIKIENVVLVRFVAHEEGVAFTVDVLVDGAGLTTMEIIGRASIAANARRLAIIGTAPPA